jgi:ABC-type phosphate/phosphonate transport system substrate-binding protein
MNRRSVAVALAALALLGACASRRAAAKSELNFSILSAESQSSAEADWHPFLDDMARRSA